MKAITHIAFGTPSEVLKLREVDAPAFGADQLLVRVQASGIAKGDWLITHGLPYIARPAYGMRRPKQPVAGLAFSGYVEAVGSNVKTFTAGDAVLGVHAGAFAELVAVPESAIARKPANTTFEQAATAPVSGIAALQALRDSANVQPGQRVLVIGASGGVGSFAVQIAKALGVQVTAVVSTRNIEFARSLGADAVVDYTKEQITASDSRFDVIIDIAGNRSLARLRAALAPRGTLVIVGGTGGNWTMGFGRTVKAMLLSPFVKQRLVALLSKPSPADLQTLADLMEAGKLSPVVDGIYSLERAADGIDAVGRRHGRGTSVIALAAAKSGRTNA